MELESLECGVRLDVSALEADWPMWSWLVEGQRVGIELWVDGGYRFGGGRLWLVLREVLTETLLLSVHQGSGEWIKDGSVEAQLGWAIEIVGPTCERPERYPPEALIHDYEFHLTSGDELRSLKPKDIITLPEVAGYPALVVESGFLREIYTHTIPVGEYVTDVIPGPDFWFSAWPTD